MAEWSCSGLQSRLRRFDSGFSLQSSIYIMDIIVTGASGFIGGSFVYEAISRGHRVLGIDSLENTSPFNLNALKKINSTKFDFLEANLVDEYLKICEFINNNNLKNPITVHFASLKSVNDSVINPLAYWENNLISSFNLIKLLKKFNYNKFIFSSSASIYSDKNMQPVNEMGMTEPKSPYAFTKLAIENFLNNISDTGKLDVLHLRYFNPVGTHKESHIFDMPTKSANNLMPKIIRTVIGKEDKLKIYGDDYKTIDGTGVRDYIHITDLIEGHFSAIDYIKSNTCKDVINLGTGRGYSVIELLNSFEKTNALKIPYEISERRDGDIECSIADVKKAYEKLSWSSKKGLDEMCIDAAKILKFDELINSL